MIAVGRLVEKKGFHFLIQAAALLKFDFRLQIYGEGPEHECLERLIAITNLGERVRLCGPVTHQELPDAFAAAHIAVVPSIVDQSGDRDGLPNVVLEAMACGLPVIATNVGAIKAAVKHLKTGILVRPEDPGSLADAVTQLATDKLHRQVLGASA